MWGAYECEDVMSPRDILPGVPCDTPQGTGRVANAGLNTNDYPDNHYPDNVVPLHRISHRVSHCNPISHCKGAAPVGPAVVTEIHGLLAGSRITADYGDIAIEDLKAGDRVLTMDNAYQPVRHIERYRFSRDQMRQNPDLVPVEIPAGLFGPGLPERDILVSPALKLVLQNRLIEILSGRPGRTIAAGCLENLPGVRKMPPDLAGDWIAFYQIRMDRPEYILADGLCLETL